VRSWLASLLARAVWPRPCAIWFPSPNTTRLVPPTDPETGLTFGYLRYTETNSNRIFVTVEALYGFKAGMPDGIKRIVKP